MNSKPHRTNSNFQLLHFLVGDCKTADGAWMLMYGQKIDIEVKLRHCEAQALRRDAKIAEAERIINSWFYSKAAKMNAQAEIIECTAGHSTWELNKQAALDELAFINEIMDKLEPHRKYKDLPLLEANEACQREEWLLELKARCENFLLSQGSIPADELRTMRSHPDFAAEIVPHIQQLHLGLSKVTSRSEALLMVEKSTPVKTLLLEASKKPSDDYK